MNDIAKNVKSLAQDALVANKKRRGISRCLKNNCFANLGKGGWLGFRNEDIVSGFVIEGSALDTYISMFVLPVFDRHKFVSWSLGRRVVHCSPERDTVTECKQAIDQYISELAEIRSAIDLVNYLDKHDIKGAYPIWVRYICYLRQFDFESASSYFEFEKNTQLHPVQKEKFEEINKYVAVRDKEGVACVINSWIRFSEQIFGPTHQTFTAI